MFHTDWLRSGQSASFVAPATTRDLFPLSCVVVRICSVLFCLGILRMAWAHKISTAVDSLSSSTLLRAHVTAKSQKEIIPISSPSLSLSFKLAQVNNNNTRQLWKSERASWNGAQSELNELSRGLIEEITVNNKNNQLLLHCSWHGSKAMSNARKRASEHWYADRFCWTISSYQN